MAIANALGFQTMEAAIEAIKETSLDEWGSCIIRKNGVFIKRNSNRRCYASITCGYGKSGMEQSWAVSKEYLNERGRKLAAGIPA